MGLVWTTRVFNYSEATLVKNGFSAAGVSLTQSNFRETVLPVCGGKSTTRVLPNATAS
jgi:hypothetical protein